LGAVSLLGVAFIGTAAPPSLLVNAANDARVEAARAAAAASNARAPETSTDARGSDVERAAAAASAPIAAPAPTTGTIKTPRIAQGRRIFVDGKVYGVAPKPASVPCGQHVLKIGGNGTPRSTEVPCGGEIMVLP
jgi:hypothetical protein